jgi:hypothetical protein
VDGSKYDIFPDSGPASGSAIGSENHSFPSGAGMMLGSQPDSVGTANSVRVPLGVIRPMVFAADSVNQRFPSAPAAIATGPQRGSGSSNRWTLPSVRARNARLRRGCWWRRSRRAGGENVEVLRDDAVGVAHRNLA